MPPDQRKRLAEQLTANPLYEILMAELETDAIERMISANTDQERLETQAYIRATRAFRGNCAAMMRNTPPKKGAPC